MAELCVCVCVCDRKVLEMCCFMEKMLANMLADYEMKVEKEVLEPLSKLSEVKICTWVYNEQKLL